jgi:hypothetical protein
MIACAAWLLALLLNVHQPRMLALALVVGVGFFVPAPAGCDWQTFYIYCTAGETAIGVIALLLRANASGFIAVFSGILAAIHGLGAFLDGGIPDSPYHVLVPALGYAEFAACILCSAPLIGWVKNRVSPSV